MDVQGTKEGSTKPSRVVLFFDIDNCLYSRYAGVYAEMRRLIDEYFHTHISPSREEAERLHKEYYTHYGLALEGLVRNHKIDPLEYNSKVDDAVDLDHLLTKDEEALRYIETVQKLFRDIDRDRVIVWLFTNAYKTHGERVARILGLGSPGAEYLFDGLTYCDYAAEEFICKPSEKAYRRAMNQVEEAMQLDPLRPEDCYFVDDSGANCRAAKEIGWTAAHLVEEGVPPPKNRASQEQITTLKELPGIFPQLFKSTK